MTKVISIDNATLNSEDLTSFLQRAISQLAEAEAAKEAFNNIVGEAVDATKMDKKVLSKWFKARYSDKTKDIVQAGEAVAALNSAVDD